MGTKCIWNWRRSHFLLQNPSQLSLDECLYLATIIRKPRKFMYQFNDQGNLKDYAVKRTAAPRSTWRHVGSKFHLEDTISKLPVYISGNARLLLRNPKQNWFNRCLGWILYRWKMNLISKFNTLTHSFNPYLFRRRRNLRKQLRNGNSIFARAICGDFSPGSKWHNFMVNIRFKKQPIINTLWILWGIISFTALDCEITAWNSVYFWQMTSHPYTQLYWYFLLIVPS